MLKLNSQETHKGEDTLTEGFLHKQVKSSQNLGVKLVHRVPNTHRLFVGIERALASAPLLTERLEEAKRMRFRNVG